MEFGFILIKLLIVMVSKSLVMYTHDQQILYLKNEKHNFIFCEGHWLRHLGEMCINDLVPFEAASFISPSTTSG